MKLPATSWRGPRLRDLPLEADCCDDALQQFTKLIQRACVPPRIGRDGPVVTKDHHDFTGFRSVSRHGVLGSLVVVTIDKLGDGH